MQVKIAKIATLILLMSIISLAVLLFIGNLSAIRLNLLVSAVSYITIFICMIIDIIRTSLERREYRD